MSLPGLSSLRLRARGEELMDDPALDPAVYAAVLRDLARANRITLAARPTLAFLDRIAARGERLRVLDVGFGQGDMLRRIARWAASRGVAVELTGIDLNPASEAVARAMTDPSLPIRYRTGDYADLAGEGWDAILSSLVAHHMSEGELVRFLRFMEQHARRGWLVNDLHRHRVAHLGYPVLARVCGWHPIVRHDGALSIARSFRAGEWRALLAEAEVAGAEIRRVFPFRLCVAKRR